MDKILAFSILSSSPADISAAGFFSTRLSWRSSAAGKPQTQRQADAAPTKQEKAAEQRGSSRAPAAAPEREREVEARPRFAPEFDGLNCFESIVSF